MDATLPLTLDHERVANEIKHWVRLTAACNSKCIFCLDAEAQDGRFMAFDDIQTEIRRGRDEKGATRLVVSGGEATLHPQFHDAVRYGKYVGYRWVQTVTNGQRLADRGYLLSALDAGLDEITFSLHGHTPELHDRLTRTKNGFENLMRGMVRAVRLDRCVVNVDVCINRQNVEHLEAIVALCARVGVREFDLLHIIPQGVAFENREELFYDVDQHADSLRRAFRLARHPDFHIWTNRFPVQHLEGMEELIQDPHKMLDEVGGRRRQFRRYLDTGAPIECRDKARCPHCFIEPFCSALDRHVSDQRAGAFTVWWVGDRHDLVDRRPPGTIQVGTNTMPAAPVPVYLRAASFVDAVFPAGSRAVATRPEHLDQLAGVNVDVEVHLTKEMCAGLVGRAIAANWILHAPTYLHAAESAALDPDYRGFFTGLAPGARAQNLPACLAPGAMLEAAPRILDASLFHQTGEMAIDAFVDGYVQHEYRAKSLRCSSCAVNHACPGAQLQYLRAHGFKQLQPLTQAVSVPVFTSPRLRDGVVPQPGSVRLPLPGNAPVPFIDTAPGRRS